MKTKNITTILLSAIAILCSTALTAQENEKKWSLTTGINFHTDFIQANKGWKPALGVRPGGFGFGFGFNAGVRYDNLLVFGDLNLEMASNSAINSNQVEFYAASFGLKLGHDFYKLPSSELKERFTFVTGLLMYANSMQFNFDGGNATSTVANARNYSYSFTQPALYVPLELRYSVGKAYIGLSYMLNVWHGDTYTGTNMNTKVIDAPDINILPLRLTFGVQL